MAAEMNKETKFLFRKNNHLGSVVQSIVSLTKLLVYDSLGLTVLTKSVAKIFLAEKL